VDIPLSPTFLRLILCPATNALNSIEDLFLIHPLKANFLRSLQHLIEQKQNIQTSHNLTDEVKNTLVQNLKLQNEDCGLEDLGLTFVLNPPSSIFEYKEIELIEDGGMVDVTIENVEQYVERCLDFYLNTGIKEQVY